MLALVGFALLLSLRGMKRDLGAPYTLTKHQLVVGFDSLTEEQRERAKLDKLTPETCVLYIAEVESRQASWLENWFWGPSDSRAALNGTSCIELKRRFFVPSLSSVTHSISGNGKSISRVEDFYSLDSLKKAQGDIEFSVPLWWTRDGKEFTRKLTKKLLLANLKQGIQ
ncbi:hypothetical protein EON83_03070 [bacterium]|nr:MAG: hypothetical protein EON83_03070 [bacterium]